MNAPGQDQRIQTICLLLLTVVAVAAALFWLRSVMVPFVFAVLIAFGLSPLINLQEKHLRFPRILAILATLAAGFLILGLIGVLISTSVGQLAARADDYLQRLVQLLDVAVAAMPGHFEDEARRAVDSLSDISLSTAGTILVTVTNELLSLLSSGLLVMIFVGFMLAGGSELELTRDRFWNEVQSRIQRYIIVKSLVSALTGTLVGIILALLGIDLALVFGVFAFLLNFIPSVGSVIATLLPLPVLIVSPDLSLTTCVLAILLPATVQFIVGNIVDPKLMGKTLDLHPVALLLALIVWGTIWGVIGMLLATPITAILKIIFERMEITAPLAEMLAGRLSGENGDDPRPEEEEAGIEEDEEPGSQPDEPADTDVRR